MSDHKFSCSHCGQHLVTDAKFSGRQIQCPTCNHLISVPVVGNPEAKGQSGMTWITHVPQPKENQIQKSDS